MPSALLLEKRFLEFPEGHAALLLPCVRDDCSLSLVIVIVILFD
jgi:hypothetical protein